MRPIVICVIALALPILAGCVFGANRDSRAAYVAENPYMEERIENAILAGKIVEGMTKEEVRASWGQPCSYCIGTRSASWGDTWEYNPFGSARPSAGTLVFFDASGRVKGWSK